MKKWMYLIFPGVMLAIFLGFYFTHKKEAEEREKVRAAETAKKAAEDLAKKKDAEAKAAEDARKRQAEHEAEMKAKEEARIAKQAAEDKRVKDDTDAALARGDAAAKQVAQLEIELDALHKKKDTTSREAFDLAKKVELTRISKRNAELEIQRMTQMVTNATQNSFLTRMPPPPPAPPKT